jgi:apolipoprotein D and lipocalin family protein
VSGVARIVDTVSNAKLQVSFVSLFGWQLFWGDYWIIGLDGDYQWAVVGHPKRKYGWILARSATPDAAVLERAFTVLEQSGYARADFELSAP